MNDTRQTDRQIYWKKDHQHRREHGAQSKAREEGENRCSKGDEANDKYLHVQLDEINSLFLIRLLSIYKPPDLQRINIYP